MIRPFEDFDMPRAIEIHQANGLDGRCMPNLTITNAEGKEVPNPLFIVKAVKMHEGQSAVMGFLKVTSELYLLIDHTVGTPEQRLEWLKEGVEYIKQKAWRHGIEQITVFVPTEIEASFGPRLVDDLQFIRSPWQSYTLNLEE